MSTVKEKNVTITVDRAQRFEQLAAKRGMSESALFEEGLDLLFKIGELDEITRNDLQLLLQLQSGCERLPPYRTGAPIDPETITSVVGTPLSPNRLRRLGEER